MMILPRNVFLELGYTSELIEEKVQHAFSQLFLSNDDSKCLLYEANDTSAYIWTPDTEDIRSEGMSYGMTICAYMRRQDLFDKLWHFAKEQMQNSSGAHKGLFAWNVKKNESGFVISDPNSAPDGEEYFAFALLLAESIWGNGTIDYGSEARNLLSLMLHIEETPENPQKMVRNFFHSIHHQIVFVPTGPEAEYTDPSYHLPAFYHAFAKAMPREALRFHQILHASQLYLQKAMHPQTGLVTEYTEFDGTPRKTEFNSYSHVYSADSWRVGFNLGMEYQWHRSEWTQPLCERLLHFFSTFQGSYPAKFTQEGVPLGEAYLCAGLVSCNAVAALASTNPIHLQFVEDLWNLEIPEGKYRYYHGLLYMMSLLQCSGRFLPIQ